MRKTRKLRKVVATSLACAAIVACASSFASAADVWFAHGNSNEDHKCFATTTQSGSTRLLGAQITWQLSGKDEIKYGPLVTTTGYQARSNSDWLWLRSGQSYGYYYVDTTDETAHESTAWMPFDF